MPTLVLEPTGSVFTLNRDTGYMQTDKSEDSILSYTLDWADVLGSDTISTSAWQMSGVTGASASSTTTTTTIKISRTGGTAVNTIVTAGGSTHVRTLEFSDVGQ